MDDTGHGSGAVRGGARGAGRAVRGLALYGAVLLVLVSCISTPPRVGSVDGLARLDRLAPVDGDGAWPGLGAPVEIVWDEHLIPSIRASSDADGAYAMGLVHAHLRRSQMEVFRKVAQGRISEMAGPLTVPIDEAIRAFDLDRAVPAMADSMAPETRAWIERYVAGVNDYTARHSDRPADAKTLGFDYGEDWTVEDVLSVGRLLSVDVNWGRWFAVLGALQEEGGVEFVERLWSFGDDGVASFSASERGELSVLFDVGKTGSNAFVVTGERSASGGALMASDPHLGLVQPNFWCVVGLETPTQHCAGLTVAGLPFVLVGRNEQIGWSGTNMQSVSSTLYTLPAGLGPTETREESIGVRWWFDATKPIRESAFGPVVTDARVLATLGRDASGSRSDLAFRWRGHDVSDEATAFFRLHTATDWASFREAFRTYAVAGQNFLFGDASGNIGQVLAIEAVEAAARSSRSFPVDANDPAYRWEPGIASPDLPAAFNPASGFLVSANNTPVKTDPVLVPQGNANDRVVQMSSRLSGDGPMTLEDLGSIQRDVYSRSSHVAAGAMVAAVSGRAQTDRMRAFVEAIRSWDGQYTSDSNGAVAYQALLAALVDRIYDGRYSRRVVRTIRQAPYVHAFVAEDVGGASGSVLDEALMVARRSWTPERVWGDVHRYEPSHPIGLVPVLGRAYAFGSIPYEGSTTTVSKAAHAIGASEHQTFFGADARLLMDLGTLDDNRVLLLGGQDGWLGSDRLLDQIELWRAGALVPMPLTAGAQDARSARRTGLVPSGAGR